MDGFLYCLARLTLWISVHFVFSSVFSAFFDTYNTVNEWMLSRNSCPFVESCINCWHFYFINIYFLSILSYPNVFNPYFGEIRNSKTPQRWRRSYQVSSEKAMCSRSMDIIQKKNSRALQLSLFTNIHFFHLAVDGFALFSYVLDQMSSYYCWSGTRKRLCRR